MKSQDLSIALNNIDTKFLEDTENINQQFIKRTRNKKIFAMIAACLAITVTSLVLYINKPDEKALPPVDTDKPQQPASNNLQIIPLSLQFGDMGAEVIVAHNINELVSNNPWKENLEINTLPVFENESVEFIGKETNFDQNALIKKAYNIAEILEINPNNLTINKLSYSNSISAVYKDYNITVYAHGEVYIKFPPISLPDSIKFDYIMTFDEANKTAEYLFNNYSDKLQFKNPVINIKDGSYNIYGEQTHYIEFYDQSDNIESEILNFNLNTACFYPDDNGRLGAVRIYSNETSTKLGDYPIISLQKAKELLRNGKYITTIEEKITAESKIEKSELIYRNVTWERYKIPYYRFYVEIEPADIFENTGLKAYATYYVPAVNEQYLENFTTWDGQFN